MKVSALGKYMRMTRLALCGQPSEKDRQVSSLAIRETRKNAQKVRIGHLPDIIVHDLGEATTTVSANAPSVIVHIMSSEVQGSMSAFLHVFEKPMSCLHPNRVVHSVACPSYHNRIVASSIIGNSGNEGVERCGHSGCGARSKEVLILPRVEGDVLQYW